MSSYIATAKVNLKMLILVFLIAVLLVLALLTAHHYRIKSLTRNALVQGRLAYDRADWLNAAKYFKLYLNLYPMDIDVLEKYALAQEKITPPTRQTVYGAIDANRRILRLKPDDVQSYRRLSALYERMGNFNELVYIAQRRLKYLPSDFQTRFQLAKAYLQLNKLSQAGAILTELASIAAKDPAHKRMEYSEICWLLGGIDSQSDRPEVRTHAIDWLDRAVEYFPDSPSPYLNRARFYRLSPSIDPKNRAAALKDLETARTKKNDDPKVDLELCYEWIKQNRYDRAAEQLQRVDRFPSETIGRFFFTEENFIATRYILASELLQRTGEIQQGVTLTDNVLARLSDKEQRIRILPLAVRVYSLAGQPETARRCLDEYLTLTRGVDKSFASPEGVVFLKSLVDWSQGRAYQVIENVEPLLERDPRNPSMWAILADAYLQTGQTRRAINAMTQYCSIRDDDREMLLRLAGICLDSQQWQKAYTLAARVQAMDPENNAATLLACRAGVELLYSPNDRLAVKIDKKQLSIDLEQLQASNPKNVQVRLARARLAFKENGFDTARLILLQAVEQCDDPLPAQSRLVSLYASSGSNKEAETLGQSLCRKYPKKADVWLAMADLYQTNRRYKLAHDTLVSAMDNVTDDASQKTLAKRLALLEIIHDNRKTGLEMLMKIARSDNTDIQTRTTILSLPEMYKNIDQAQRLVDEIRQVEGAGGLLWRINQCSLWLNTGRWNENRTQITEYLNRCIQADPEWPDPVILLGRMYERMGEVADTELLYRRAIANQPSMVGVTDELISLLEKQRRYVDALEIINTINAGSNSLDIRRINLLVDSQNISQAINELQLQVANHPEDVNSRLLLARLAWQELKDVDLAMKYLDQADSIMPNSMAVLSLRAAVLNASGKQNQALALLDQAVKKNDTFENGLVQATFLSNIGKNDEAEQAFLHLTALDKNGLSYEILGKFYADHKRFDDAVAVWKKGIDVFPSNATLKRRLVKALLIRNQNDDKKIAIDMLDDLEKEFPNDADLLWVRALVMLDAKDPSQKADAVKLIQRVIQLNPQLIDAHLKLISLAIESLDFDLARDLAIRALAANPDSVPLLLARARAEKLTGNDQIASQLARLVLEQNPENTQANELIKMIGRPEIPSHLIDTQIELAWQAFQSQDYDRAEKIYQTILACSPSNLQAINNLAWILSSRRHDPNSALALADRGLKISPDNPDLLDTRASILSQMPSKLRQACRDYRRCLDLLPADSSPAASVMLKLADLNIRINDLSQAREWLDRASAIDRKNNVFTDLQRQEFDRLNQSLASAMQPAGR
jgi:predicted Zn-dependent protease